jgi:hypothetical protein
MFAPAKRDVDAISGFVLILGPKMFLLAQVQWTSVVQVKNF